MGSNPLNEQFFWEIVNLSVCTMASRRRVSPGMDVKTSRPFGDRPPGTVISWVSQAKHTAWRGVPNNGKRLRGSQKPCGHPWAVATEGEGLAKAWYSVGLTVGQRTSVAFGRLKVPRKYTKLKMASRLGVARLACRATCKRLQSGRRRSGPEKNPGGAVDPQRQPLDGPATGRAGGVGLYLAPKLTST